MSLKDNRHINDGIGSMRLWSCEVSLKDSVKYGAEVSCRSAIICRHSEHYTVCFAHLCLKFFDYVSCFMSKGFCVIIVQKVRIPIMGG